MPATAAATPSPLAKREDAIIRRALSILESRQRAVGVQLDSPQSVRAFLRLKLADSDREQFGVLFLDAQNHLLSFEILFVGTLAQTAVYPREVAKRALALGAQGVILSHNHPSGVCEPSQGDEYLTQSLKATLKMLDVVVLDHIVVSRVGSVSMAERGLV